jgi:hypothetical protein
MFERKALRRTEPRRGEVTRRQRKPRNEKVHNNAFFINYYHGAKIKEDEMTGECISHGISKVVPVLN